MYRSVCLSPRSFLEEQCLALPTHFETRISLRKVEVTVEPLSKIAVELKLGDSPLRELTGNLRSMSTIFKNQLRFAPTLLDDNCIDCLWWPQSTPYSEGKTQSVRILNRHPVDFAVIGRSSVAAQATIHWILQQRPIVLYVTANVQHLPLLVLLQIRANNNYQIWQPFSPECHSLQKLRNRGGYLTAVWPFAIRKSDREFEFILNNCNKRKRL